MPRRVCLPLAFLAALSVAPAAAQQRCAAVDGDTLRCGQERVRIMGLDTPEVHGACPRERRLARQATDRMRQLIAGGVFLQPHGRDRYRRLLAVVTDRAGRDVAPVMIREGLARENHGQRRSGWCSP